jgi:putative ABC transport system ATP-binding protein
LENCLDWRFDEMQAEQRLLLRLSGIYKGARLGQSSIEILKDINLSVYAGQSLAIVGPSGSGKSTLLHILSLLTPPDRGDYRYEDERIDYSNRAQLAHIRRNIGLVFQDAKLIPDLSVVENVAVPLMHAGVWPAEQKQRATAILDRVGLSHRMRHRPQQLSGGEKMRVAVARAMCMSPRVLLADEPTGSLDSHNGELITQMLFDMVNHDTALVLVTHHPPLADQADRQVRVLDGEISTLSATETDA